MAVQVTMREYAPTDLRRVAELAAEAWPIVASIADQGEFQRLMEPYVMFAVLGSTWRQVLFHDGRLVGVLLGQVKKHWTFRAKWQMLKYYRSFRLRLRAGEFGPIKEPEALLERLLATEKVIARNSPRSQAVVELFVVDSDFRGRGLGQQLMSAFLEYAAAQGVRLVQVYTDPLSNWRFYERYGYTLHRRFEDPLNTFIAGQSTEGFLYIYDLTREVLHIPVVDP